MTPYIVRLFQTQICLHGLFTREQSVNVRHISSVPLQGNGPLEISSYWKWDALFIPPPLHLLFPWNWGK